MPHCCREIQGGRLIVHVVHELRSKQTKAEKTEAKTGKYVAPKVSVRELKALFPYLTDVTIKTRLKEKCECMPVRVSSPWLQQTLGASEQGRCLVCAFVRL